MPTDDQNAVLLVQRGYDEPHRCLDFRVGFYTWSERPESLGHALAAINMIGQYNDFEPELVQRIVREHCSTGVMKIYVGRESSPALYFDLEPGNEGTVLANALRDEGRADEVDFLSKTTLRAWWD